MIEIEERIEERRRERGIERNISISDYMVLLGRDGNFSPCCNCERDCVPGECLPLAEWI